MAKKKVAVEAFDAVVNDAVETALASEPLAAERLAVAVALLREAIGESEPVYTRDKNGTLIRPADWREKTRVFLNSL